MTCKKDHRKLFIDKEALATLSLIKEGILAPVYKLMNEKEANEIDNTNMYKGQPFPMSFTFAPNGKRNQEVIKSSKKGEILDLMVEGKKRGEFVVDEVFKVDQSRRIIKIFGESNTQNPTINKLLKRLGENALSGEYETDFLDIKEIKSKIEEGKINTDARNVSAMMIEANPFHRAHERLLRVTLEKSDLLVLFLLKPYSESEILSYELRLKSLQYFVDNYVHKNRILIIPFDNTYIYSDTKNAVLDAICAYNFGCNKLVIGENYDGIGMYYDKNKAVTVFDSYKQLDVEIISKFVYCNKCKTLVNIKTCPHGSHHHIKYNSHSLLALIKAGILPPAVLMRKDISAILLSELYPNRFENVQSVYYDLFPGTGLIENHTDRDFYLELMKLYQTTSLT